MRVTAVSLLAIFKLAPNKSRDQEVTYVSIVSMNQFCFLCKIQNEVSVSEYMVILVKHYDVIPYLKLLWFRCCYTPTADTGL